MLGVKGTTIRLGEIDLLQNPFGQIISQSMTRQVQHLGLDIRLRADVTIAGGIADGAVQNRGFAAALIRRININENGDRSTEIDPRALKVLSAGVMAPREQLQVAALPDGTAQANTILEDFVHLPFANPLLGSPHETNFLERDPDQPLDVEIETVVDPDAALILGGDRVLTVNAFTAEIGHEMDRASAQLPTFIPLYRQIANEPVGGALSDHAIVLKPKGFVAMLLVQQIGGGIYEVSDVISRMELKGTNVKHFEGRFTDDFYRQRHERKFGGVIPAGYTVFNFLENGRFGGIHNPITDPDLRLIVDADVSATAGASSIRIWALEFNQDPQLTVALPAALVQ